MQSKLIGSILATLCYSDVFDYPLTVEEVHQRLIHTTQVSKKAVALSIAASQGVAHKNGYLFLPGREKNVISRMKREKFALKKIHKARKVSKLLSFIPGVLFVGLSGSVAVKNCKKNDDIDLFVITASQKLWMVRCVIQVLLFLTGNKRKPLTKIAADRICVNMLLSENFLSVPKKRRTLYTAYEITQIKPLFNRGSIYEKFITKNVWIKDFLPNTPAIPNKRSAVKKPIFAKFIDRIFFTLQYHYMKKRITNEEIGIDFAYFHPNDISVHIMDRYKLRLLQYNLLPDKDGKSVKSSVAHRTHQPQFVPV